MEKALIDAIATVGFPIVACIFLGIFINGRIKKNDERMDKQDEKIEKLEAQNKEDKKCFLEEVTILKSENKEDKHMFKDAMNLFRESVNEFKTSNKEINSKVDTIQDDVVEIKQIIEYKIKEK